MSQLFTTVILDQARRIRFSNRAIQRVGELPNPLSLTDLNKKGRQQAALMQWLWGCLVDEDAAAFATPADLADKLPCPLPEQKIKAMVRALYDAIELAQPKNADSSTPSPSPASS